MWTVPLTTKVLMFLKARTPLSKVSNARFAGGLLFRMVQTSLSLSLDLRLIMRRKLRGEDDLSVAFVGCL